MEVLLLNDLLRLSPEESACVKVRFNQHNGTDDPMELYKSNPDKVNVEWLFWKTKQRYFSVGQIAICLLKLSQDQWLLTTIKRVTEDLNVSNGICYHGEELEQYRPLFGRVIIRYHKDTQSQGRMFKHIQDDLIVSQILPAPFDGEDFPGYDNVRLSFPQLKTIIDCGKRDWEAALKNQKAVYLITDKHTGKLYVGSATGKNGMLWKRWSDYVTTGHGGNVRLEELIRQNGKDYAEKYFQYSILENYNFKVDDSFIIERESWWKETLQSRKWGYNDN